MTLSVEGWALFVIIAAAMTSFYTRRLRPDLTALLVVLALAIPWRPTPEGLRPLLSPVEAFSGFGSPAVAMVIAMFVVSTGMVRTGVAEILGRRLLERCARSETMLQAAILLVVTVFSSVVNDTAAVLVWMPLVVAFCRERGLNPSRYLLGVAYGSLLGGQWTLIGTRSNIVVSDYLFERTGTGLGFFEFTPIAIPITLVSLAFYLTIGVRFLPKASAGDADLAETYEVREFLTEVMVTPSSAVVGKMLIDLNLRESRGVDVIEIIRDRQRVAPSLHLPLRSGDVLIVQGPGSKIARLLHEPTFQVREEMKLDEATLKSIDLIMVEAVVGPGSAMVGREIGSIDFLGDYGLSVMAVAREGRKLRGRLTDLVVRFGDTLLLYGHLSDVERIKRRGDLILVASQPFPVVEKWRAGFMLGLLGAVVATVASGALSAAIVLPLAAAVTVFSGCVRMREVYGVIDWMAVVVVGGMIPYGLALEKTGTASWVARELATPLAGGHPTVLLGALLLLTVVLTQLIENVAVVIVVSPIAYHLATTSGLDPRPVMLGLAIAASSAFLTPVAHESTILVMGPGRYQFRDYLRVGSGFALVTWLIGTLLTAWLYPLS